MTEGDLHKKAVEKLMRYLRTKGYKVEKDKGHIVNDNDRLTAYYPDITATKTIIIEVNGPVGHSSKRSHENELNQKEFFDRDGMEFFVYSPEEITGRGYVDSKGHRHTPHKASELFEDWDI